MKKPKYYIRVGEYILKAMTPGQIKTIHNLIGDFLESENNTSAGQSCTITDTKPILITQDNCFENGKNSVTEYCACVGNDSLTNLSEKELIKLYFTLQSFLIQFEKLREKSNLIIRDFPAISEDKDITIEISNQPFTNLSFNPCENPPFIGKRVQLTDENEHIANRYTLNTPYGTVGGMTFKNLVYLYEKTGELTRHIKQK